MPIKIKLEYVKSTKNTHVYASQEDDPAVPTLYIRKGHRPVMEPEKVVVRIEWEGKG